MQPFSTVSGVAAPLLSANIDTDVIMPKQFLKGITRDGLRDGLLYDLRFDANGIERSEFILNQGVYRSPTFLVVGPNFGCGSSREHAVWGLDQFGIRALIGTSFASIFHDNCLRNGLLPIRLSSDEIARIQALCIDPERSRLSIDLQSETILLSDATQITFKTDPLRRDDLLHGRDPIASTLRFAAEIGAFERQLWAQQPWFKPDRVGP